MDQEYFEMQERSTRKRSIHIKKTIQGKKRKEGVSGLEKNQKSPYVGLKGYPFNYEKYSSPGLPAGC